MEVSQNKSDVTNRFGVRDFALAVSKCFIRKCDRFEVLRDFRSLNNGEIHFRSMEASNVESDVINLFSVLIVHFAGICHLSCSV
jgi:hypothetical protein